MNTDLIKQLIFAAIRQLTPLLAAYLSNKYGITSEQTADGIAAIGTLVALVWSVFNKIRYEAKVNTALDLPKSATKADLKEVIDSGNGTSATASK